MRVLARLVKARLVTLSVPGALHKTRYPTDMDDQTVQQRRHELRKAVIELRARGLNAPAKWAAEQLTGLPNEGDDEPKLETTGNADETENDTYLLAKSYFDLKVQRQHQTAQSCTDVLCAKDISMLQEYLRVAHVLRGSSGNKANFLRCYSLYLAGEKHKEYVKHFGCQHSSGLCCFSGLPAMSLSLTEVEP